MKTERAARTPRRPQAGFTLIELLITLLVVAEILIIAGLIFDLHNKTARAQNHVAPAVASAVPSMAGTTRCATPRRRGATMSGTPGRERRPRDSSMSLARSRVEP